MLFPDIIYLLRHVFGKTNYKVMYTIIQTIMHAIIWLLPFHYPYPELMLLHPEEEF